MKDENTAKTAATHFFTVPYGIKGTYGLNKTSKRKEVTCKKCLSILINGTKKCNYGCGANYGHCSCP